ncbi:LuxR C-terminal-related transcriptional regulator [Geodermatophilus aquaeductus]|uniref:LuxR family transcriptional regulator, maltose regulon positive regulatory protein n=1 Tax=Geodermatophilus aquaeductus TaxID=1564161 RepID=A0A521E0Z7_9ACTN|nr:LuxR family transcriptional regulator [Geodermatophilus aquaeductus]SMO77643.1 LuxR family transcriptional regulator, maltose regulon positive regulatory protein [Geodermatophilus aquaeductus]
MPATRRGVVPRPGLLARLQRARGTPVVAVVAPAGYGKTTLLVQWSEADDRPVAWVSLDPQDDDPVVLLTHLAVALDRVSTLPAGTFEALRSPGTSVQATVVPRLGAALARPPRPLVLVVDDVHHLREGPSLDALVTLAGHARGTTQIALAGRGMPVPLARLRAQGRVVDVGTHDLAFSDGAARSLLRAAGADLPDDEVAALARRTEGWAAGLYLAARARTASRRPGADGGERLAGEYLQAELLTGLAPQDLDLLTRTSVLDRLCGALCDAVLDRSGSAAELERLQGDNLFLVPLDGQGTWYRYHPILRDLLRARLDRTGGDAAGGLLRRAAAWCEADGRPEAALRYAQEAGDVDRVARIAVALGQPMYAAGRSATLLDWFTWVDERGAVERHPAMAALAAYLCALTGRPAAADRWADLAERWADRRPAADDPERTAMWLTAARVVMCRGGPEQMRRDLEEAGRRPGAGSAADVDYPMRLFLHGVAALLLGDDDGAAAWFDDAAEIVDGTQRPPLLTAVLSYRALLQLRQGDWRAAEALVERARSVVRRAHTESHVTSVLVFTLAARVARHRGDPAGARACLGEAQRLRPLLSHALPWVAVEALLEMAEVALGLGDAGGSRVFVRDAEAVLRRRPDLGVLGKRTDEVRGRLGSLQAGTATLTTAELRVLPLLLTHLTLEGIADRLSLSRHTVKAQVWSAYRKLGVHTRGDAVARAQELGLLET